ncbi:hypothetical protein LIER_42196 [Lithospermum erythrorhizon]
MTCPRVNEDLMKCETKIFDYITRSSGSPSYEVTYAKHGFVVDIDKNHFSCGMWQLDGMPCVHAVCVYKSHNKGPKKFVHQDFHKSTWLNVYSQFLEPL